MVPCDFIIIIIIIIIIIKEIKNFIKRKIT